MGADLSTPDDKTAFSDDILARARNVGLAGTDSTGKAWFASYSPGEMEFEIRRREAMTPMRLKAKDLNTQETKAPE